MITERNHPTCTGVLLTNSYHTLGARNGESSKIRMASELWISNHILAENEKERPNNKDSQSEIRREASQRSLDRTYKSYAPNAEVTVAY